MIRISQTAGVRRGQRDLTVFRAVQTAVKNSGVKNSGAVYTARLATIARQARGATSPGSPVLAPVISHGAAGYAQMTRALLVHNTTSPVRIASICTECCGEAKIIEEYREGIGRYRIRICLRGCCGWRDDYSSGLGLIAAEPAVPEGKGSLSQSSTLAYVTARLLVLGGSAHIGEILDPIGKLRDYRRYQKHNCNTHDLVQAGVLIRDDFGVCRLARVETAKGGVS